MKPATYRPRKQPNAPAPVVAPAAIAPRAEARALQSPIGLYQSDPTGACVYVNERWCALAGLPAAGALGDGWTQALHPEDRQRVAVAWSRAVAAAAPFVAEYRYLHPDGSVVWVYDQATPEIDEGANVVGFAGLVIDITERRLAEAALRTSEARFRAMAEATATAFWTVDERGEPRDAATTRWPLLTDLPPDELAAGWLAAVHPDDREPGNTVWQAGLAEGQAFVFEQRVRQRDGSWRHFVVRAAPVRDADGAIREWVGADIDITERRRAEAELRERDELLRLTMQAARAGAWSRDLSTDREEWSPEIFLLLGRQPDEIEPAFAELLAVVHPDDRDSLRDQATMDIPSGREGQAEFRVVWPDGSVHWILARGRTIIDAAGAPRRVGLMLDITERKQAEEALRRGEERYRTLFESVDQGFCIIQLIAGQDGRFTDYRFEEVNPTFARHTGLADAVGKTARELVPDLEDDWVDVYGFVAATGERRRFEQGSDAMGRWFEVDAVRIGEEDSRRVALLFSDVTERKRAEDALREGARQHAFRATLADALRPLTDPGAIQAEVSRILGEHFGVNRAFFAETDGDGDHVVIRQDYHHGVPNGSGRFRLDDFGAELAAAFRAGCTVVVNDVAAAGGLSADERAAYAAIEVRAHATVCLVKNGRLMGLLGVRQAEPRAWTAAEVTLLEETAERTWAAVERANAEAALRQSERRLQALADAMPQVVWAADADGTVRYYNSRVAGFAAVTQTAPGAWDWQPTLHPDDVPATTAAWQRAVREASPYAQEHRILMTDGQYRWHLSRAAPIADATGQIETWYGTATDIHDLKQAEIERRENEERLRLGIDVAGFALLEIDYAAGVIHLSAEAARLYGVGDEAVTVPREQVHATFHPDDRDDLTHRIARTSIPASAEPYTTEYRIVWPSGEVRWLSVRKQIVFERDSPSPRPIRAMLAALDITARKQAEADRQALLDALAHDLRNPLTALKIQAQLLLRQFDRGQMPDRDTLAGRVSGFVELASRMTGLIDDLEEHARLALGSGVAPDRRPTDLVALVRSSVEELQESGSAHAMRFETDERELVGSWDPLHVHRVLENLLGNPVKYSPLGSDVRVRLSRAGREAVIEVHDDGIGIPAADLPHISAFRHRGGNVGSVAGSGVGLAGVKQMVERHGGTVTAQSQEGRGSVFTVRLPLPTSNR